MESSTMRDDLMHESLVVYNHEPMRFPRRRHPELVPAIPRDRDVFSATTSTSQISSRMTTSMTKTSVSAIDGGGGLGLVMTRPLTSGPKRAVSMTRLDQLAQPRRRYLEETLKQRGNGSTSNNPDIMVKSMIELPAKTPSQTNKSRLNKAVKSKEGIISPNRPTSSMSQSSEQSSTPSVPMRPRVSRKPRPLSMVASIPIRSITEGTVESNNNTPNSKTFTRRDFGRNPVKTPSGPAAAQRTSRARSAGVNTRQELSFNGNDSSEDSRGGAVSPVKPTPPRKPAHVKAAAAARKAVKQTPSLKAEIEENVTEKLVNDEEEKNVAPELVSDIETQQTEIIVPVDETPVLVPNTVAPSNESAPENKPNEESSGTPSKKEISEDEYKRLLAEKRRLAREQAEREAELERQRQEDLKRVEEERILQEEEEMRRFEEEQLRLAEEHRRVEEEKLRLAIEEQTRREDEARLARQEEARLRLEREEQELKAREEAERQRQELEERLRKDEEERLARKKRIEAIMSRTRKTPNGKIQNDKQTIETHIPSHLTVGLEDAVLTSD